MQRVLIGLSALGVLNAAPALANELELLTTFENTDWTQSSLGSLRGAGYGTLALDGVSGSVTKAFLYWHGPTTSTDPSANANVSFAGTPIVGTQIGFADDNNWGSAINSQAYRADVTALVTGNGNYALSGFENADALVNGVSLIVTYDDGDSTNNRDVTFFDGNDSIEASTFDSEGWNLALPVNGYTAGAAFLTFFVSDGQIWNDPSLYVNGIVIAPSPQVFDGDTVPAGPGTAVTRGYLWDVRTFEVTSFLTPGNNVLNVTMDVSADDNDRFSLIAVSVDLQAAAPVPEPSVMAMLLAGLGLTGYAAKRRRPV